MGITRRQFLERMGEAGGYGAAFLGLQGLGVMPERPLAAQAIAGDAVTGKGVKVVVLGAGIAGMVAAYELRALGYDCVVLEARGRPGGRNYVVRGGDTVEFVDGTTQRCLWDGGHYQNFGPGRLPSIHRTMLGYCRSLGVPLEVEINSTLSSHLAYTGANGGKPLTKRRIFHDAQGHVAELLAKCVATGSLDAELTGVDRERMLTFLRTFGPLDNAGKYVGSDRAGYAVQPGAGEAAGVLDKPLDLETLLNKTFWNGMLFDAQFDMQATMFQPVGGMDRIAAAFAKSLGKMIRYDAPVTSIEKTDRGIRIAYTERSTPKVLEAHFCVCTMTLNQVKKIRVDLSPAFRRVVDVATYANAYKVAWESRRFWEQDDNIYGGLEFCDGVCSTVWLPSAGLFSERGVLVSGYGFWSPEEFDRASLEEKLQMSRASMEVLHPGRAREMEKPMYVGWHHMPWSQGAWIETYDPLPEPEPGKGSQVVTPRSPRTQTSREATASPGYQTLLQPDGPIYFAGDGISHINAWQEGAALSARRVVDQISRRTRETRA